MTQPYARDHNRRSLKRLMKKHGKNCRQIADLIGYSHISVRRWACGQTRMEDRTLRLLTLSLKR